MEPAARLFQQNSLLDFVIQKGEIRVVPNPADEWKGQGKRRPFGSVDDDIQALAFNKAVRKGFCASFASVRDTDQISRDTG